MTSLFQLSPFLLLILLYGLCPQHFPPSAATTSFFILYAIAAQLIIHRASTISVLHSLSIILLSAAHLAVAAIYTLYYTVQAVMRARSALFAYFERVHRQIHQLANLTGMRLNRVPAPTCLTLGLDILRDDQSTFSETTSAYSSKNNTVHASQWRYRELSSSSFVPPSFETRGYLPYQPYPIVWFFRHLFYFTRAIVLCIYSTLLSIFFTVKFFHNTTIASVRFTGACFKFMKKYLPTSWYLAKLSIRQFPTFTLFAMHLTVTIIVLSLGETNALGLCILMELWLLSRLERL
ncbi:uncharacterized protein TrAtP1_007823 [Trichoderma atroviride]|uniref:Wax synthase domain-containing protein n=1 Tax=Hypocrea atroviridis (strain ATCC 20476 / IMI 206040) TaxID=452589 RepID=G9NH59_HYPAI|nr:uncharacterized protein TRIATDRAFT_133759 [Trichoderma atroviride IMI 206040]EHK49954.1 hypothetical protein TRIATDRAFT_133759 [Trichoderma atroviride IMI 206040]UKZ66652.1 hypothetical protein TrAtP1_007823 [Trichoderma atroviride]